MRWRTTSVPRRLRMQTWRLVGMSLTSLLEMFDGRPSRKLHHHRGKTNAIHANDVADSHIGPVGPRRRVG